MIADSILKLRILKKSLETKLDETDLIVYERNDLPDKKLPETELREGQIILSTSLAGRGVDIKLNETVLVNGGLHVCLTFLSINSRVEDQAFGRASRQGQKGSGEIILDYQYELNKHDLHSLKRDIELDEFKKLRKFIEKRNWINQRLKLTSLKLMIRYSKCSVNILKRRQKIWNTRMRKL